MKSENWVVVDKNLIENVFVLKHIMFVLIPLYNNYQLILNIVEIIVYVYNYVILKNFVSDLLKLNVIDHHLNHLKFDKDVYDVLV